MGADGRIHIWNAKKVTEAWPSYRELINELEAQTFKVDCGYVSFQPYWHTLADVEYLVLYSSTCTSSWREFASAELNGPPPDEATYERFSKAKVFVRWLSDGANQAAIWKVWT